MAKIYAANSALPSPLADSNQPPTLVGRDPADPTLVGLDPTIGGIEARARSIAPDVFAGVYRDDAGVHVGLTRDVANNLALLQAAFPGTTIEAFSAQHSWDQLLAIRQAISTLMASPANASGAVISVGANEARNLVEVGVADLASAEAQAIAAAHGGAVDVFKDEPPELLGAATTPTATPTLTGADMNGASGFPRRKPPTPRAPGRDQYVQPMLAGMHIYIAGHGEEGCTAGFMYQEHRIGAEEGVITAGHCFNGELPAAPWRQGQQLLGLFSRNRDVHLSHADAGTITTKLGGIGGEIRKISNRVFLGPNIATATISSRKALNAGASNDPVCLSGAYSGFYCGKVMTGGLGKDYFDSSTGILTRNVYSAKFTNVIMKGDSGAPVYDPSGIAAGILFAAKRNDRHIGFYSQIQWVEKELGGILPGGGTANDVRVFTG